MERRRRNIPNTGSDREVPRENSDAVEWIAKLARDLASLAIELSAESEKEKLPHCLVDAKTAAKLLCMSEGWVREATQRGDLPAAKLGRRCVYDPYLLIEWARKKME